MIDAAAAMEIARKRSEEKGWSFAEPFNVVTRRAWFSDKVLRFEIQTSFGVRGTASRFVIDATTGKIIVEGYIPR